MYIIRRGGGKGEAESGMDAKKRYLFGGWELRVLYLVIQKNLLVDLSH